jgi:hypothetical protein
MSAPSSSLTIPDLDDVDMLTAALDYANPVRCRRCRRALWAPLSVSCRAGRVCRRHLLAELVSR